MMMTDAPLPEVVDLSTADGRLLVRWFPAEYVTAFKNVSKTQRRDTPAVVRRLYAAADERAEEDAVCLICNEPAPATSRIMVAVETDGGHEIGCVCTACATWGFGNA